MANNQKKMIGNRKNVMGTENAQVLQVELNGCHRGYVILSYFGLGHRMRREARIVRLNVFPNTVLFNAKGRPISLCEIRKGMMVDALFSSAMTRSIPPQSTAYLLLEKRRGREATTISTGPIAAIDLENYSLFVGNPWNIGEQQRFNVNGFTIIRDPFGKAISFENLRMGQMVAVAHSTATTMSIPPQSSAFYIQQM